jgi:hypothetical protein
MGHSNGVVWGTGSSDTKRWYRATPGYRARCIACLVASSGWKRFNKSQSNQRHLMEANHRLEAPRRPVAYVGFYGL